MPTPTAGMAPGEAARWGRRELCHAFLDGRLEVKRGNSVVLEQPLQTAESVEQGSLPRRAFDAIYESAAAAIHQKLSGKK